MQMKNRRNDILVAPSARRDVLRVQFVAQSNAAYTVQYQSNLAATPWLNLSGVAAQSIIRTMQVNDPLPMTNAARFYRVIVP
jgi:hypothetical protein